MVFFQSTTNFYFANWSRSKVEQIDRRTGLSAFFWCLGFKIVVRG